jgi:hypothetical protein
VYAVDGTEIMKIGDFEINMPDPPLQDPHCIAILKPWINVGNVGKIVLGRLGRLYAADRIGKLERPGKFYDFTRYRPTIRLRGDVRSLRVPNTRVKSQVRSSSRFERPRAPRNVGATCVRRGLQRLSN